MRNWLLIILCACALASCREYKVSDDPTLRLAFSCDTLRFDTVFTEQGSSTLQLKVYNPNANALIIKRIWLEKGDVFRVNVDGEPDLERLTDVQLNGKDSILVFVRFGKTAALGSNLPVLMEDRLHFLLANEAAQSVLLEAYGQDVTRIGRVGCGRTVMETCTFTGDQPYMIFDTLIVSGPLNIQAGATLYMHQGSCLFALDEVNAQGTLEAPIVIRGDRLDRLFDSVPYSYAGGSWNGIYLQTEQPVNYQFHYVDILSGNIGLYCFSTCTDALPMLRMDGCRIHNHTLYGLILQHVDALVTNTEISNCASYCVYCDGGKHDFVHSTIASYFNYTSIRIQSVDKEEVAAVYIDNLAKTGPQTVTSFYNSIITGYLKNQLVVATPFDRYYPGSFVGNYLKTDTLAFPHAHDNTYRASSDTTAVFVKDFYKYKEYVYYDFRPDSLSPVIGIADSIAALPYPTDRNGLSRSGIKPDAGCYQHQP